MEHRPNVSLKRERSPSPVLSVSRRLITSGSVHIRTTPPGCVKSAPNSHEMRRQWVRDERRKLTSKGLTVTRSFIRDDGLVLDWESTVPIWSDTLVPAVTDPQETIIISDGEGLASESNARVVETYPNAPVSITAAESQPSVAIPDEEADRIASELEDMAIDYLKRYAEAFDTNRDALAHAYALDASFSYCIHDIIAPDSVAGAFTNSTDLRRFAPRKGSRNLLKAQPSQSRSVQSHNLHRGPTAIVLALKTLGPHKFCVEAPTEISWNVVALPIAHTAHTRGPVVFLTSSGDLTELRGGRARRLSFDQAFVLARGSLNGDTDQPDEWPMVAVSHQLTVRDVSLRPPPP